MEILRTPDSRFEALSGYPFAPHYAQVSAADGGGPVRMHYVDEGPRDGAPIVLLHGEPTWSYLYRTMIPPLAAAGYRVLAPDLIGFGRSDKPTRIDDYSYLRHVQWVKCWLDGLNDGRGVSGVTLFGQDWGSLIGLRLAGEQAGEQAGEPGGQAGGCIARLVIANGFLPTARQPTPPAFIVWRALAVHTPVFPTGRLIAFAALRRMPAEVRRGYDAPFPDRRYQAGARAMPRLVPTSPSDPAIPANRAAWAALGRWHRPFLALFGTRDPILGRADKPLIAHVPGAAGQPHARIRAGHFIQEDAGPELARRIIDWSP